MFSPYGFQVPVNGYVDGQAGRFEEVREQIPLDDPRLGDAHLCISETLGHSPYSPPCDIGWFYRIYLWIYSLYFHIYWL